MKTFKVTANGITRHVKANSNNETIFELKMRLPFELVLRHDLIIDDIIQILGTVSDHNLAKRYPKLAERANKNNKSVTHQAEIEQANAVAEYEDTYIVNGRDILTGARV